MQLVCQATCEACQPSPAPSSICSDATDTGVTGCPADTPCSCSQLAGICTGHAISANVQNACPVTCGTCSRASPPPPPPLPYHCRHCCHLGHAATQWAQILGSADARDRAHRALAPSFSRVALGIHTAQCYRLCALRLAAHVRPLHRQRPPLHHPHHSPSPRSASQWPPPWSSKLMALHRAPARFLHSRGISNAARRHHQHRPLVRMQARPCIRSRSVATQQAKRSRLPL